MVVPRYLDVVLVAIVAIPAIALGVPTFGYLVGAGAWILQRLIAITDRRLLDRATEDTTSVRKQLGFNLFEPFMRIWLLAGAIVLAGVAGHRADGLTAAIVIFAAYSIALAVRLMSGPPPPRPAR
ncbi:MAG TPA: hypothetical protein VG295_00725 [Solirubrobacteraceae bacterium]|jgi:hypothetical protein|nr:hypothetical protein [Solirubrobacteraceae bacterium]